MENEYGQAFREEALELLAELEGKLLSLEKQPDEKATVNAIFRALHTIKGSGGMFGFDDIAAFAHELESLYDEIRNARISVSPQAVELTLRGADEIRAMLGCPSPGLDREKWDRERISLGISLLLGKKPAPESIAVDGSGSGTEKKESAAVESTFRIRFKPARDVFRQGGDPLALLAELAGLGDCLYYAHVADVPRLDQLDPLDCHLFWDIVLTTGAGEDAVRDLFIFYEDGLVEIALIDAAGAREFEREYKKLGDILVERGDLDSETMVEVLGTQKRFGELAVAAGAVSPENVESALLEQQHVRQAREKREQAEQASSIRVSAGKVDKLVDLVGELVTTQARLSQIAQDLENEEVLLVAEAMERLTSELRDNTMVIRMVPMAVTFTRLQRLIRDLSRDMGKEIDFVTLGGDTELDKSMIEKLNDPLVHIIRNSIDHGLESSEERIKAGKKPRGTITLAAEHAGAGVIIRVSDDGRGLDEERIRSKAVERGLISADAQLSPGQVWELIFAPGFSTAREISNVSGRGVGMDVVKKNLELLRGSISVDSRPGSGMEITLKLPLTLAIIDGLLVRVCNELFIIPLGVIEECVEMKSRRAKKSNGKRMLSVRDELVPYISLADFFSIPGKTPDIEQVIICETENQRLGIVVDKVIGELQTVIKPLSRFYKDVPGLGGASILGDGTVALILDIAQLGKAQLEQESRIRKAE